MDIHALRAALETAGEGKPIGPFDIDIALIRTDPTLQVRDKLDTTNLQRLRSAYRSGATLPAISIAFIKGDLDNLPVCIDGHHRLHTLELLNAESTKRGGKEFGTVSVLVSHLAQAEARYAAAKANSEHGLQLKPRETRRVFNAYVRANKHRQGIEYKSYREIGKELQRDHKTIITWMKADFPATAAKMGEPEKVNYEGNGPAKPMKLVRHDGNKALLDLRNAFDEGFSGEKRQLLQAAQSLVSFFEESITEMDDFDHDHAKTNQNLENPNFSTTPF